MTIRSLPKVELHCHLEGCFQPATLREVGRTLGIEVPADPEVFRREWLITEPMTNLGVALAKFAKVQSIWGSEEVIERLTFEACEYGRAQGIRIFELRYSPDFIAEGHPNLTFEKIHRAIVRGVARAAHPDLAVGLIGIVRKILPAGPAAYTTDFIIENRDSFVGIDLADRDIGFDLRRFAGLMSKARAAGLRFTTHCGEDDVAEAALHVRMAIEDLCAERIGHGIFTVRDPQVMELARRRGVLFEHEPHQQLAHQFGTDDRRPPDPQVHGSRRPGEHQFRRPRPVRHRPVPRVRSSRA
ncbi:MAG: adenosine deaminase [Gammaproteobacteria bacterium]|nr:adenosine deaminase [Gammaproteobacteria bacterium]